MSGVRAAAEELIGRLDALARRIAEDAPQEELAAAEEARARALASLRIALEAADPNRGRDDLLDELAARGEAVLEAARAKLREIALERERVARARRLVRAQGKLSPREPRFVACRA